MKSSLPQTAVASGSTVVEEAVDEDPGSPIGTAEKDEPDPHDVSDELDDYDGMIEDDLDVEDDDDGDDDHDDELPDGSFDDDDDEDLTSEELPDDPLDADTIRLRARMDKAMASASRASASGSPDSDADADADEASVSRRDPRHNEANEDHPSVYDLGPVRPLSKEALRRAQADRLSRLASERELEDLRKRKRQKERKTMVEVPTRRIVS